MTLFVGLTGSIGMGKSTTAAMFADLGIPVWDADAAVHKIYGLNGAAVGPIGEVFPQAIVDGEVSRLALKVILANDPKAFGSVEGIVHPLVADDRQAFMDAHQDSDLLLFDIPLLFETKADQWLDVVICVTTDAETQRARVLARPGMTEQQFEVILARQTPDADKRQQADYIIKTNELYETRASVEALVTHIKARAAHA